MKRYAWGLALGLVLADFGTADAQTAARVEYRDGRVGVAVAIGDLPVRVRPAPVVRGGGPTEVRWAPVTVWAPGRVVVPGARVVVHAGRGGWHRDALRKNELRDLVGRDAVRTLERHARTLDARGPMEGRWYRADRRTVLLEVTVGGDLVGEFVDHGADGTLDRFYLAEVPGYTYRRW